MSAPTTGPREGTPGPALPGHRVMVALDIENSTALTNPAKATLRQVMYDLLEGALQAGGIFEAQRDPFVDRGDGVLALIHPVIPGAKVKLLNPIVPTLRLLLVDHNEQHPDLRFRLRVAVHAGDVHRDSQGCFGEALDITFRLLDSPRLKRALKDQPQAPMVLAVSDEIHHTVVEHDYPGIAKAEFASLGHVRTGRDHHRGWLWVPDV